MRTVNIGDLRNQLSAYLQHVKNGEEIVVCDRNTAVARILPIASTGIDEQEKNIFGQKNEKDTRRAVSLGFIYTLPMLVNFQAEVYHDGIVRLQLMREDIPISKRLRGGFMVNTDKEYMTELKYILNKNVFKPISNFSNNSFFLYNYNKRKLWKEILFFFHL